MFKSPEHRFSFFYAALFASIGSIGPFFAVWLDSLGIDAGTIGVIAAAPSVLMVFTTVFIGRWADTLKERRTAIVICNLLILMLQLILFWPAGPWQILMVWSVSGILMHAMVPVTDAAALRITEQRNSDFARVRVFGSIGFVVAVTVSGFVYERLGMVAFVPVLFFGNLLRLWLSATLPRTGASRSSLPHSSSTSGNTTLYNKGVLLTIVGASLIQASHAVVYTFGILLWTQQGVSETTGSLLIAIGVVAEVWLMWRFKSLTKNLSARGCLIIAALCGVLRWGVLATSPGVIVVYLAQMLHGVTFGLTFLATANFIARRVGEADAARGQGLSATMATAGLALATYLSGVFYEELRMHLYWIMAAICVVSIVLLALSYLTNVEGGEADA